MPTKVLSFKADLQLSYAIDQAGEDAGISNAAVLRQLAEYGISCIEAGSFQLRPEAYLRSDAKKLSAALKEKYRQERIEASKFGDSEMPHRPRGRPPKTQAEPLGKVNL